jgi:hypothetical protein
MKNVVVLRVSLMLGGSSADVKVQKTISVSSASM